MKAEPEIRCQEALSLLKSLEDRSVSLLVTDPPYGISYQSNRLKKGKTAPIQADWNFQIGPFLREADRVLVEGGAIYIFTRWDVYPLWQPSITGSLKLKNLIVWVKDNHTAGDLTGNFGGKWEGIMMITKGRHHLRGPRYPNVWEFNRVPKKKQLHPAEKPVSLLERIIESSSDENDLIVDPFCGSGSTGEAAMNLNRRSILGDVDKRWLNRCLKRFNHPPREDWVLPVEETQTPKIDIDLSALDGIHPEDVAMMLQDWLKQPT